MRFYPGFRPGDPQTDRSQRFQVFRWRLYLLRLKNRRLRK